MKNGYQSHQKIEKAKLRVPRFKYDKTLVKPAIMVVFNIAGVGEPLQWHEKKFAYEL